MLRGLPSFLFVFVFSLTGAAGFTIMFDYTYDDTNDFFSAGSDARNTLEAAGALYESLFTDTFDVIDASLPGDTWSPFFLDPETGNPIAGMVDLFVPADTVIIYVGGRDLPGAQIGQSGFGEFATLGGSMAFIDAVRHRGEGDTTDFGRWGGSLAVDINVTWNLDHTVLPGVGENDLYSLVLHELGHVFGQGLSNSWNNLVDSGPNPDTFTGALSAADQGGDVDLDGAAQHWADGTVSNVYGGGPLQEAAFDPSIFVGTRKLLTELDVAGLDDIGWDIAAIPEPSSALFAVLGIGLLGLGRWKRASR